MFDFTLGLFGTIIFTLLCMIGVGLLVLMFIALLIGIKWGIGWLMLMGVFLALPSR